jgi:hypothetical protein
VDHTSSGIPFVEPADVLVDYPAVSLELAEVIGTLAWRPLPLLSGAPIGGAYAPPAYAIDCHGLVHVRGVLQFSGPTSNLQMAILPPCVDGNLFWGQLCAGTAPCRVELYTNGAFNCVGPIPDASWLSLTGISYDPRGLAARERGDER